MSKPFHDFKVKQTMHINNMLKDINYLYIVEVDKDALWDLYLNSFPAGTNEIYRKRREFDCSCCRQFIKNFGNVVSIKNGVTTTIWDFETNSSNLFQPVVNALSAYIKACSIKDFFITADSKYGTDKNYEQSENPEGVIEPKLWEHFYFELPAKFVTCHQRDDVATKTAQLRDIRNVFKRSLAEISESAVLTVLELIAQKSLYRGEEWESVLKTFLSYKKEYDKINNDLSKELYCWEVSANVGPVIGKIRNHSIGTLLIDISDDTMDLNEAVKRYEKTVAPENYKRPQAIYTKKMLEDAKNKLEQLGLLESLGRRYAHLDDITINNVLFANRDAVKRMGNSSDVFETLSKDLAANPKSFDKVEGITIDDFINNVLPSTTSIEVLLENKHAPNFVSLIAPKVADSQSLFKWDNNFSWAYTGNITDSLMRERVKAAGGKIDGVLRFSIQWNEHNDNNNDFDAHCIEPNGHEIYFANKRDYRTGGNLDVDIVRPENKVAVENITFPDKSDMLVGEYKFFVHNFNNRGGRNGFTAEIEFDGQIYSFTYNKDMRQGERVNVATVALKNGVFTIKEQLPSSVSSRKVWNLDTNQFHPVSVCLYSPNYWDDQKGIGNRHYFFMLKNCINSESPNGFFNEYLKESLLEHKRVFEALGSKMRVEEDADQLSGLGFSSTKRNSIVVKVTGNITRTLKIIF